MAYDPFRINLTVSYLTTGKRYLLMHQFQKEVSDFLIERKAWSDDLHFVATRDIIEINQSKQGKKILLVLHGLSEHADMHAEKISNFSSDKEVRVIHLWEDLWKFQRNKIVSKLDSLFGQTTRIHGRETVVKGINNVELLDFLSVNHLNVPLKAKYKYGLFQKDKLMAVMSFSKSRVIQRDGIEYDSFELLRFCNRLHHTVVGGFSKLLNHFISHVCPDDIMTYVDKDWSDGSTYEQAGFQLEGTLESLMFYLDLESGERYYSEKIEKQPDSKLIKVYNAGSLKYIKYLKKN